MDLAASMLSEFEFESALTRSVLKTVPDSLFNYKAGDDFQSIGWNVSHLVDIPTWIDMILNEPGFDIAPIDGPPHETPIIETVQQAIENFDSNVQHAKQVIDKVDVEKLDEPWSLLAGGQPLLTHPRYFIYRMYVVSHVAHHRGHLLVYLRTNGIPVPNLYG